MRNIIRKGQTGEPTTNAGQFGSVARGAPAETALRGSNQPLSEPIEESSIRENIGDEHLRAWRTTTTFAVDSEFASAARRMLGVSSGQVSVTEVYSEYGHWTVESCRSVKVECAGQSKEYDDEAYSNPMSVMLRQLTTQDEAPPIETAMRLVGQDPYGNNLVSVPVRIHRLEGEPLEGTIVDCDWFTARLETDTDVIEVHLDDSVTHIEVSEEISR